MRIGIDMMGGDFAPNEIAKGLAEYLSGSHPLAIVVCIGDEDDSKKSLSQFKIEGHPLLEFVNTKDQIGYHEPPTKAFKEKPYSSIPMGFGLLSSGRIDAFISAGNTGAMLVGAMLIVKTIEGVLRPTVSGIIPRANGSNGVLLDAGMNTDCKPEYLNHFAILGSLYSKYIFDVSSPKVGLINVGEEEGKGNALSQAAYHLLKENSHINFIGNIEGRDLFSPKVDVMVCDGFVGNVTLKTAETFYDLAVTKNLQDDEYVKRFHYENYGGSPILGISKPVIIGHGISTAKAYNNMFNQAVKLVETDLSGKIKEEFTHIN